MKPADDRQPARPAARRPRFRIDKLEERIAPSKGGAKTKKCATAYCGDDPSLGCSSY